MQRRPSVSALAAYTGPTGYACQVGSIPGNYTYEGNISYVILNTGVPALQKDSFYNPGFAGSWNAWAQALQDGGVNVTTLFTLGGEWGELWSAVLYQQQQPGDGSTNLYTSDQAGGDGYSHDYQNTSVELSAAQELDRRRELVVGQLGRDALDHRGVRRPGDGRDRRLGRGERVNGGSRRLADNARLLAGGALGITRVSPSKIQPNTSSSVTLTLLGSGTSWTSGSTVTINNSVVGTTTVTAGTLTVISGTHATLAVTTGTGAGTYTITLGGATSPNLVVGSKTAGWHPGMSRASMTARACVMSRDRDVRNAIQAALVATDAFDVIGNEGAAVWIWGSRRRITAPAAMCRLRPGSCRSQAGRKISGTRRQLAVW